MMNFSYVQMNFSYVLMAVALLRLDAAFDGSRAHANSSMIVAE